MISFLLYLNKKGDFMNSKSIKKLFLIVICFSNFSFTQAITAESETAAIESDKLLNSILNDFQKLRVILGDALEKNVINSKELNNSLQRLNDSYKKIDILDNLDPKLKNAFKDIAKRITDTYKALLEEAMVINLWMRNYKGYEDDLNDNFHSLPNEYLKKPDNKKLYEELGFKPGEGQKKTFNSVRQHYPRTGE